MSSMKVVCLTNKINKKQYLKTNKAQMNEDDFWHKTSTLKTQISWSTWRYVNSQNTATSLKHIHFIDKIKPLLIPKLETQQPTWP